ncbi:MAG: hypothetical protein IJC85_07915 [Oscillospiraceae bacterium]|nr:hypothetical protein [Oscillospiraceae bacterium]
MKKMLAFLLAISLCLSFAACSGDDNHFVKPTNYATVLVVTINPQFKLYLDNNGVVLATEPVNEDAKAIMSEINLENKSLESVIKEILVTANENGFVKTNATVDFEIAETVDTTVDTAAILTKAKDASEKTAKDENIIIAVEIVNDEKTESESSTSAHQHSYANATCTEPKKCSCGATEGSALGHEYVNGKCTVCSAEDPDFKTENNSKTESESSTPVHQHSYKNATCTEPKKCSCGATEGKALGHKYTDGKCTVCGAEDPDYVPSYTSVKEKVCNWEGIVFSADGNTAYSLGLVLYGDEIVIGAGIGDKIDPDMPEAADAIEINGNLYYFGRGTGGIPLNSVTEDGTTVTIVDGANGQLVLTRVDENTLKVTSSPDNFGHEGEEYYVVGKIPVGTIFEAVAEE